MKLVYNGPRYGQVMRAGDDYTAWREDMILFDTKETTIVTVGCNLDRRMEIASVSEEPGLEILANRTRLDLGSGEMGVVGGKEPSC